MRGAKPRAEFCEPLDGFADARSGAGGEELSAVVVAYRDVMERRSAGELHKLVPGIEVTQAGDRFRRGRGPA